MKDSDKEKIIGDLLYEAASRRTLNAVSRTIVLKRLFSYAVAAVLVLGVIAFSGILNFQDDSDFRQNLIAESYSFPKVNKSRSGQINIVDSHIDDLNSGRFDVVLKKLVGDNLSEMDTYVKAHLLFESKQYDACSKLVESRNWNDEYLFSDLNLLQIYIAVDSGIDTQELKTMLSDLTDSDLEIANTLISKLEAQ